MRIISAIYGKRRSTITRVRDPNSAAARTAAGRVPGYIDVVPKWATQRPVRRDHWFVVEMIFPAGETEKVRASKALSTVSGFGDGQLSSIDAVAAAEEYDDVAVEKISPGVEHEAGIRAETNIVCSAQRWRKGCIDARPRGSVIERSISAHGIAKDLVRPAGKVLWPARVYRHVSFALWTTLVRDIHVRTYRRRATAPRIRAGGVG